MLQKLKNLYPRVVIFCALKDAKYKGDCWKFSESLDASFEEYKGLDMGDLFKKVDRDLEEYRKENPTEFKGSK